MSDASNLSTGRVGATLERFQRPIAVALSALLHILALAMLLYASKMVLAPAQGASGGARVKVDFVGTSQAVSERTPVPPAGKPVPDDKKPEPKPSPDPNPQTKQETALVEQAKDILRDTQATKPKPQEQSGRQQRQAAPTSASESNPRPDIPWGQPPGSLDRETAPVNIGQSYGPTPSRVAGQEMSGHAAVGAGGHQIYYDLFGDTRLRGWKEAGMTEVSFPLPGLRQFMVCPLEIVLRRGDGGCRLVEPDDAALSKIGDAREVVQVVRVYRRGELIWRGPGMYR